jgi:hypothetical protein
LEIAMTTPVRAALYMRVSTGRQAASDRSAPPGEGLLYVARMGDCRRLCRARPVRDRRSAAGVPAHDRSVEVDQKELRIMGSKSVLLRTLIAGSSAKTAGFGVPTSGRTRFERVTAA